MAPQSPGRFSPSSDSASLPRPLRCGLCTAFLFLFVLIAAEDRSSMEVADGVLLLEIVVLRDLGSPKSLISEVGLFWLAFLLPIVAVILLWTPPPLLSLHVWIQDGIEVWGFRALSGFGFGSCDLTGFGWKDDCLRNLFFRSGPLPLKLSGGRSIAPDGRNAFLPACTIRSRSGGIHRSNLLNLNGVGGVSVIGSCFPVLLHAEPDLVSSSARPFCLAGPFAGGAGSILGGAAQFCLIWFFFGWCCAILFNLLLCLIWFICFWSCFGLLELGFLVSTVMNSPVLINGSLIVVVSKFLKASTVKDLLISRSVSLDFLLIASVFFVCFCLLLVVLVACLSCFSWLLSLLYPSSEGPCVFRFFCCLVVMGSVL